MKSINVSINIIFVVLFGWISLAVTLPPRPIADGKVLSRSGDPQSTACDLAGKVECCDGSVCDQEVASVEHSNTINEVSEIKVEKLSPREYGDIPGAFH